MTAQELTNLRKSKKLTKSALARILNITYQTVKRWEQGSTGIQNHRAIAILAILATIERANDKDLYWFKRSRQE